MRAGANLGDRLAVRVSRSSRAHKTAQLERTIPDGSTVLAVGISDPRYSSTHNQVEIALSRRTRLVGLYYPELPGVGDVVPFPLVRGDGCRLPFADDSFDYVVSNAVIEHVGDAAAQQRFMRESLRVARTAAFHTTPNRWGPVETHTKLLVLHWLPRRWHKRLLTRPGRYRWQDGDRLLSRRQFEEIAGPGAVTAGWPRPWPLTLTLTQFTKSGLDAADESAAD